MPTRAKSKTAGARAERAAGPRDVGAGSAERARGGVQSIGRGFAIMEEIARNRDGIGLADLSKRVGLHNSTTFHLVKTMVSLGYVRQLQRLQALPHRPAAVCARRQRARRDRDDEPRHPGARGFVARNRRERAFLGAHGRRRGGAGAHQRAGRFPVDRPGRRGAAGALHGLGQDHAGGARARPVRRSIWRAPSSRRRRRSRSRRPSTCAARSPRCGAPASPSTTASSTRNCAAWRCRCAISAARSIGAIGISGPVWRLSIEALQKRARIVRAAADRLSGEFGYTGDTAPIRAAE